MVQLLQDIKFHFCLVCVSIIILIHSEKIQPFYIKPENKKNKQIKNKKEEEAFKSLQVSILQNICI